ncbi:DUF4352 domain-containing protein [Neobacillus mesonae]|nr:DUF4352 domain-containing protein [Neobacillus mesonae]
MSSASEKKTKKPIWKRWWFWVLIVIIVIAAVNSGGEGSKTADSSATTSGSQDSTEAQSTASNKSEEEPAQAFKVGDQVEAGTFTYTVKSVKEQTKIENILGDKTTEGKFVVVELNVKNNDKEARYADTSMFRILANGNEYEPDSELDMYVNDDGLGFFLESINPGLSKTGFVAFELGGDVNSYDLQVSSGMGWSGGEYQTIKLK